MFPQQGLLLQSHIPPVIYVAISDRNVASSGYARIDYERNGTENESTDGGDINTPVAGEWLILGTYADYEFKWDSVSGSVPDTIVGSSHLQDTWQVLGVLGLKLRLTSGSGVVNIQIRLASTSDLLDSANVTLDAT